MEKKNLPIEIRIKVDTKVVKVPKVPLEVRMMLTYPEGYEKLAQQEVENQFNEPSFISKVTNRILN